MAAVHPSLPALPGRGAAKGDAFPEPRTRRETDLRRPWCGALVARSRSALLRNMYQLVRISDDVDCANPIRIKL